MEYNLRNQGAAHESKMINKYILFYKTFFIIIVNPSPTPEKE